MKAGPAAFKAGAFVLKEGESGSEMFIIESGSVEILRGSGAAEARLGLLEPGDFFGEMALLDDQPRSASARAVTDCRLLAIDATTFDQMLRQYPEIAVRMLRSLAARLRAETARAERAEGTLPKASPVPAAEPAAPPAPEPKAPAPAAPAPAPAAPAPAPAAPAAPAPARPRAASHPARAHPPPAKPTPNVSGSAVAARPRALVPQGGAAIPLPDQDDVRLGRFDSVTGLAPDVELGPLDTKHLTSRRHARLVREGGETFVLEEIGTANGTFVNGVRITTGVKTRVKNGDVLRLGGVELVYSGD